MTEMVDLVNKDNKGVSLTPRVAVVRSRPHPSMA
jgi:hypothetical protein